MARRFARALSALTLVALPVAGAAAAPGDLDTTWGTEGVVTAPKASGNGVAVTADGKVLVADASARALRRYTPDGTPDPSFGGDGVVSVTGRPAAVAIDDGGRIVLAGTILYPVRPETDVWVAR